ncbi:hypothetical protein [Paenibacillus pectinilyticus]|nr:hypothetical protein [Paenibacillus pectinilyticus]
MLTVPGDGNTAMVSKSDFNNDNRSTEQLQILIHKRNDLVKEQETASPP